MEAGTTNWEVGSTNCEVVRVFCFFESVGGYIRLGRFCWAWGDFFLPCYFQRKHQTFAFPQAQQIRILRIRRGKKRRRTFFSAASLRLMTLPYYSKAFPFCVHALATVKNVPSLQELSANMARVGVGGGGLA